MKKVLKQCLIILFSIFVLGLSIYGIIDFHTNYNIHIVVTIIISYITIGFSLILDKLSGIEHALYLQKIESDSNRHKFGTILDRLNEF